MSKTTIFALALAFLLAACSSRDPEMMPINQGNLDPVHEKMQREFNADKEANISTPSEQDVVNITSSSIKLLYIDTAPFKFYDYARLNTYKSGLIKLELFKYAQTIGSIRFKGNRMCVLTECSYKWPITKKFFGAVSYDNMMLDILFGRDIFAGRGKQVLPNGVIQRFQQSGEMIYYERSKGHTLFKNMTTGVSIVVDDYVPLDVDSGVLNNPTIPN